MPMNPEPGESREDFLHRCISHEMDKGHPQEQAVAMCISMFEGKSVDPDKPPRKPLPTVKL